MRTFILCTLYFFFVHPPLQTQTINIEDGDCFFGGYVLNFSSSDAESPARNIYSGVNSLANPIEVRWDNGNSWWELVAFPGVGDVEIYTNTFASYPNPPKLGTGTWNNLGVCVGLIQFDGSGTQTTLPVELISFEGKTEQNKVVLYWITASEINNEKFEIEHSTTGWEFYTIGSVPGKGTSLEMNVYAFEHPGASRGTHYYRLKQIDFDGAVDYSEIITLSVYSAASGLSVAPNPSLTGKVYLALNSPSGSPAKISLFDLRGQLIHTEVRYTDIGLIALECDFSTAGKGLFFIRIEQDRQTSHAKLIIE